MKVFAQLEPGREISQDDAGTGDAPRMPRVLLADDDPELREYLAKRLRGAGYEVLESADGAGVLDVIGSLLVERKPPSDMPDIVVLDVRMPGINGLQVLCGLRNADWPLPVLIVTAREDEGVSDEVTRLGANGLLRKPFSAEAFIHMVDSLAGKPLP